MIDGASVLGEVCGALDRGGLDEASAILARDYPFVPFQNVGRHYNAFQSMRIFIRDGFIDRYSGKRLVFPGTLRVLSILFPNHFPFHSNWKTDACHFAYYELSPSIDHITPVSRGGADAEENWITTSMLRNAAKGNFLIEELGWTILPAGDVRAWDGLTAWFLRQDSSQGFSRIHSSIRGWAEAARKTFAETGLA